MPRLFIAFDVPAAVRTAAGALRTELRGARWTNTDQQHVTMRFLGETPAAELPALRSRLSLVRAPAFTLRAAGLGTFPPSKARQPARILFATLVPDAPVLALKDAIDTALGPDAESAARGFSPHLTLARFREDPGVALATYLQAHAGFTSASWTVAGFALYASTLTPEGARHEVLQSWPLVSAA